MQNVGDRNTAVASFKK